MYTAKVVMGHVASFDPGASQMQISVAIELYGSYDPVVCVNTKTALGISWGRTVYVDHFSVLL